ncbi:hypothetical protein [Flagellimonas lutaonensis]|uniref:Uncharacterized protein n=1 Tax=Flagellimonas lutaonensis TaxID=516051 RepID=A0A0D5YTK5_9FLAO|nr:hypothetical protein [Allomuricauda lutaonensis]AKA35201.1 hypothetical protein VC82_1582 [Allomuricauda lutaonensis]
MAFCKINIRDPFLLLLLVAQFSCTDTESAPEIDDTKINFEFQDGFETDNDDFQELFPSDNSRWTTTQIISPNAAQNSLDISMVQASGGYQSLHIQSRKSDGILSKADIEKGGFTAPENSTVIIEADFYIDSDTNIENLFLIDLECCSCWDPSVEADASIDGDNKCPGVRLVMSGGNDYLSIERGKIAGSTLAQITFPFPRKEWVTVRWQMQLSPNDNGTNQLFINGQQALSETAKNLPNAEIFKQVFAENGINFELQEPVAYERVQIGATANPNAEDLEIYVDNFSLSITND